jgi:hypothetical protein
MSDLLNKLFNRLGSFRDEIDYEDDYEQEEETEQEPADSRGTKVKSVPSSSTSKVVDFRSPEANSRS